MVTVVQAPTTTAERSVRPAGVNKDASDAVMGAAALNSLIAPAPRRAATILGREGPRPSNLPRPPKAGAGAMTEQRRNQMLAAFRSKRIDPVGRSFSDPDGPPVWACQE